VSLEENLQAIQQAIGPKRIKTPQEEVEQFDLADLLKAANARGTKKPFLQNITFTKAVPKCEGHCKDLNRSCHD
jgi:hypothetical protein